MNDKTYKIIELTGISANSIEDAVNHALERAGQTLHNLSWFQVVETRGNIENNKVKVWQVTVKIGFELD
jgi:dodecin